MLLLEKKVGQKLSGCLSERKKASRYTALPAFKDSASGFRDLDTIIQNKAKSKCAKAELQNRKSIFGRKEKLTSKTCFIIKS